MKTLIRLDFFCNKVDIAYGRLVIIFIIICGISACQKSWICRPQNGFFICVKGNDTIFANTSMGANLVNGGATYSYSQTFSDSLINYYIKNGYTVTPDNSISNVIVTDPSMLKAYELDGYTCN